MMLVGRYFEESTLLRVAYACETAMLYPVRITRPA
jgi:Asp-tRNA(Asn)/Glu-tRNA(Gln) amidotransferase A subunit family amidase